MGSVVAVRLLLAPFWVHQELLARVRANEAQRDSLVSAAPAAVLTEIRPHQMDSGSGKESWLLMIRNDGGPAAFNAKLRVIPDAEPSTPTGWFEVAWGMGGAMVGERRAKIPTGDQAALFLARSKRYHYGFQITLMSIQSGLAVDVWRSGDNVASPKSCTVEVEIFAEPTSAEKWVKRFRVGKAGVTLLEA